VTPADIASAPPGTCATPRVERRGSARIEPAALRAHVRERHHSQNGSPTLVVDGEQVWWPARVRDLSTGGIGLVLRRAVGRGTILELKLQALPEEPPRAFVVRVAHATVQSPGLWFLGCTFLDPLPETQFNALLARPDPA